MVKARGSEMTTRNPRLILNGKKAKLPGIREPVEQVSRDGHNVDVRVTWERGHAAQIAAEAIDDGVEFIVAGGGYGTVHEFVNGIFPDGEHMVARSLRFGILKRRLPFDLPAGLPS